MRPSTRRLLSLLLTIGFLIGAFMVYSTLLKKEYQNVKRLRGELGATEQLYRDQRKVVDGIIETLKLYQGSADVQQTVSLALPNRDDAAFLLYQTDAMVRDQGLVLDSIGFNIGGTVRGQEGNAAADETGLPEVRTVQLSAKLTGTYEQLKAFLKDRLETNIRIMDMESLTITPPTGRDRGSNQFTYSLTFTAYYQNIRGQATPPGE